MGLLRAVARRLRRNAKNESPSVNDYKDKESLARAMKGSITTKCTSTSPCSMESSADSISEADSGFSTGSEDHVDWTLSVVDKEVTEPQTMDEELKRLQVLQSYFILDSEGEAEFDRITRMGSKLFDTPMCLISLIDFGRQWFLSRVGVDVAETPRELSFCAHVIQNKFNMMIVPDATKDFRFKDHPMVTGGPEIRFYAGAALVSPEGYKLGTLCVVSGEARPDGLPEVEQEYLHEMAAMVVSAMVARRNRLLKEEYETQLHGVAKTFMETNTKLDQAQRSIAKHLSRNSWDMDSEEAAELNVTSQILDVQSKVCISAARNIVRDTPVHGAPEAGLAESKNHVDEDDGFMESMLEYDKIVDPTTDMQKLFDNVNSVCANFPRGEVTTELHKSVPRHIVAEDLLLFRSTLNLLTHCMAASRGQNCGLRIRTSTNEGNELLVQCVQGGVLVPLQSAKRLFADKDSLLAPVATMVRSMGGRYGMFEGRWERHNSKAPSQSIYWFRIPFGWPEGTTKQSTSNRFNKTQFKLHEPNINGFNQDRQRDEIQWDPFQQSMFVDGCSTFRRMQHLGAP